MTSVKLWRFFLHDQKALVGTFYGSSQSKVKIFKSYIKIPEKANVNFYFTDK